MNVFFDKYRGLFSMKTLLIAANLLATTQVFAETPSQNLRAILAQVNTYSGAFAQQVKDVDGKLVQEGKGHLDLAKPGKINWQMFAPALSRMISDQQTLWLYDPDLEQVTLYNAQQLITDSPFALLTTNDPELWKQYTIQNDSGQFVVLPKNRESQVTKIALTFDGNRLVQLTIWDASEQQSHYKFSDIVINRTFKTDHFSFKIPADTDIDDQRN